MFELIFILFIAFIPMLWVWKANKFTKEMEKAPVVDATVVNCQVVPRSEEWYEHFIVTYEYVDAYGVVQYYTERSEKVMELGRRYRKFLIKNAQGYMLVDTKMLQENKNASSWPFYIWTICVSAVGIIIFIMNHSTQKTEFVVKTGFFILIGLVMVFVSLFNFKRAIDKRRLLRNIYVQEIQGTIVDYKMERGDDLGARTYFPLYECFYNGEVYKYKRSYSMSVEPTIGERHTLYIDTRDNKIFEKGEIKVNIISGIVFGSFGVLALAVIIIGLMQ